MAENKQGLTLDELEKIDPGGVIRLKGGKRYPLTKALISLMYRYGVESIETELLEHDPEAQRATHRAVITGTRGMYAAHGDCCPKSVSNRGVLPHYQRISETRAIGRALRWYLGLGETVFDELGSMDDASPGAVKPAGGSGPAPIGDLLPMLRELQSIGCTIEAIDGLLKSKGRPPLGELSASDFAELIKWLKKDAGRKALHEYHIAIAEGRKR